MAVGKIWNGSSWEPVDSGPTVVQNAGRLGDVSWWPFADLPDDAVACEGQQITSAWPELRAFLIAKGSPFGTAGGNPLVINLKGRFPVGQDTAQVEFDTLLETGGAKAVTLTANQSGLRAHAHGYPTDTSGNAALGNTSNNSASKSNGPAYTGYPSTASNTALNALESHNNLPPYTVGRWIMRARTTFSGLGSNFATEDYVQQAVPAQGWRVIRSNSAEHGPGVGTAAFCVTPSGVDNLYSHAALAVAVWVDPADFGGTQAILKARGWCITEADPTDSTLTFAIAETPSVEDAIFLTTYTLATGSFPVTAANSMYKGETAEYTLTAAKWLVVYFYHSVNPGQAMTWGYTLLGRAA